MATDKTAIIGALPGYNSNIDKDGQYANRLMSNINTVILEPCGYSINMASALPWFNESIIKAAGGDTTTGLYKIGSNTSTQFNMEGINRTLSTQTALDIWADILTSIKHAQSGIPAGCQIDSSATKLELICSNDSTFTEVFSNNYKTSWMDEGTSGLANNMVTNSKWSTLFKKAINVKNLATSFDSGLGRASMRETSKLADNGGDLLSILSAKTLGYQTTMPKEWANSNYDNGLQLMIRLVSPSGHYKDIFNYIVSPLMYLIAAASPVTYNGISFGYPPLWRIKAQGLQNITLGAISTLTIQRGGTDTIFNKFNQPLNVDVRLSLESIIAGYATGLNTDNKSFYKGMTGENRPSIVTNPRDLIDSFTYLSGATGDNTPKEISVKL